MTPSAFPENGNTPFPLRRRRSTLINNLGRADELVQWRSSAVAPPASALRSCSAALAAASWSSTPARPRNAAAEHMQGFISRDGTPRADLLAAARAEIKRYGVEFIEDCVTEVTVAKLTVGLRELAYGESREHTRIGSKNRSVAQQSRFGDRI